MTYTQHPLSAAFPAMSDADLESLTADIAAHGQREPGVIFDGQVLDGWHRFQACERAGVEFVATEYTGNDPVSFVISRNAHRRHLTASQRAAAVVMCAEWAKAGRPKKGEPGSPFSKTGDEPGSPPPQSNEDLAKAAGTTVRTVQQAKRAVESGLGDAVRDGQMSAKAAVAVAKGEAPKARGDKPLWPLPGQHGAEIPEEPDLLAELDAQIKARDTQIAALTAADRGAELLKQVELCQHYQREIGAEQDRNARLIKERDTYARWQNQAIAATGEPNPRAALTAIRRAFQEQAA